MYLKITNKNENHHGYQYIDGLNVLDKEFDNNPKNSCTGGGLYFTNKEFIHKFYDYGIYLRIVELPIDDPEFRMIKDPQGDKWRANKIILKERYLLADIGTYDKFEIYQLGLAWASVNNHLEIVKYVIEKGADIHAENDQALRKASRNGHLEIVKLLIEKGANIHAVNDGALHGASFNGHLEIVKLLTENGADIHAENDRALQWASENGHLEIVKLLIDKGANIHAENDGALRWASLYGHSEIIKFLKTLEKN
ncbi:MAG: repeat protein [Satyrvirus sp.]|uniref:Repeat protein n=1 Tax=Satyrvirus sp. TaxID=2487771 RepID=A0A3G5ADE0_9VIRU|nr:MAG: repeat protein [Satyrvirus sp.]